MLGILLLGTLLAATAVVATVCVVFWDNIVGFLKKAAVKIKEKIQKAVYGVKVLATRIAGKLKQISKNYVRNGTEWEEYVITKEIEAEEVPDYIRNLENNQEVDFTNELELQLV